MCGESRTHGSEGVVEGRPLYGYLTLTLRNCGLNKRMHFTLRTTSDIYHTKNLWVTVSATVGGWQRTALGCRLVAMPPKLDLWSVSDKRKLGNPFFERSLANKPEQSVKI